MKYMFVQPSLVFRTSPATGLNFSILAPDSLVPRFIWLVVHVTKSFMGSYELWDNGIVIELDDGKILTGKPYI